MPFTRMLGLILLCHSVWGGAAIHLKSRTIHVSPQAIEGQIAPGGKYWLVQFDRKPGPDVRAELARRGFRILSYVPEWTLMLEVPPAPDLGGLGVQWTGALEPSDKLSKPLRDENTGAFLVLFHPGVDPLAALRIVRNHGLIPYRSEGLLPGHILATGNHQSLALLAAHEEVAYILPAGPELFNGRRIYGCPGPLTEAGAIADYSLADSGWPKDALGNVALQYVFDTVTAKLGSNVARSQVEMAFAEWARYANITFTPALQAGAAREIEILFATGAHGDAYPFTSITTLAHTFYPAPPNPEPVAGDMHFNDAESWVVGNGIDLYSVALHETGHALGLGHSDIPSAVMYPYYKLSTGLTSDDIAAIQALYGVAGWPSASPGQPATPAQPAPPQPTAPEAPSNPGGTGADTVPPAVNIVSPAFTIVSTSATAIAISGTATDNVGVSVVKWSTSAGDTGTATGTSAWSAVVPLLVGTNTITIRAYDAAGNSGWRSLTAVRK